MNLGTVLYCPPRGRLFSDEFMANLSSFKTRYPVHIISDDPSRQPSRIIDNPEKIRFGRTPTWAINNFLFFKAMQLARDAGLEYWLYIEVDSRVYGDFWDEIIWSDFFDRYPSGITCAGSPVVWDVSSGGAHFAKAAINIAYEFSKATGLPGSFYGMKSPHDCGGSSIYPNGSLSVYHTSDLLRIFAGFDQDLIGNSRRLTAFDLELGRRLWHNHGDAAASHVGFLTKSYSGFGDCLVNYNERKKLLLSGKLVAIHQVKDGWVP